MRFDDVYDKIDAYYTRKVQKYGPTPSGTDWTCVAVQQLRFVQLLKVCDFTSAFSLNDLGCGYGALVAYLTKRHPHADIDYLGVDLSAAMIAHAVALWSAYPRARFVVGRASPRVADYSVASGIFNVKLDESVELWEQLVARTMGELHSTSRKGFAINFMAHRPGGGTSAPILYRIDPTRWARWCERELSSSVQVLADYGLREFTLLVRRTQVDENGHH